ncbi:MAG: class I SAM-dependent methyltransferase [Thaumarchaeota archaeon]|nr:class I SAM-dependent methyltransferase [Nitrososphaerota archaeon]
MDRKRDAYGQLILAHFLGKNSYEFVEREDGFLAPSGGAKNYFSEYPEWPEHQRKGMRYATGRILDIGCGAGRVSLYLQARGLDVVGIDNSPLAIEVCRKRGLKKAKIMSIADIGEFEPSSFDTVVLYGNNFGLFGSREGARRLLKTLHRITSTRARIIAESRDPYGTDDPVHLAYHRYNQRRGRMPGQLKIRIRFRDYVGGWFSYLLVSKEEMRRILSGTGWKAEKFFDGKDSAYVAVIKKE